MVEVQFFTECIARKVSAALEAAGIDVPVYAQVNEAEAEHDRVEVRCDGVSEVIPGNYTMRLDCSVVYVAGVARSFAAAHVDAAAAVGECVRGVLSSHWHRVALEWPEGYGSEEEEAEYALFPFVVLDLFAEPGALDAGSGEYEWQCEFRAYVQF